MQFRWALPRLEMHCKRGAVGTIDWPAAARCK
jgi:hypothetical protein